MAYIPFVDKRGSLSRQQNIQRTGFADDKLPEQNYFVWVDSVTCCGKMALISHVGLVSSPPVSVYLADVTVHQTRDTPASGGLPIVVSQWVTQPQSQLLGLNSTLSINAYNIFLS
jgi:hypothetical protein